MMALTRASDMVPSNYKRTDKYRGAIKYVMGHYCFCPMP